MDDAQKYEIETLKELLFSLMRTKRLALKFPRIFDKQELGQMNVKISIIEDKINDLQEEK